VLSPATAMVGELVAFMVVGIPPPETAFLGLANPATISIAVLNVPAALPDHANLDSLVTRFLVDGAGGAHPELIRFAPTVVMLSGFINDTRWSPLAPR
jgi:hypothetical protein